MTLNNKYLSLAADIYGLDGSDAVEITDDTYADTAEEVLMMVKGEGIEHFDIGCDDGILCIFDEGELKLTAYISTRGSLFQAGAYDGEKYYAAHNMTSDGRWYESNSSYICAQIAESGWNELHSHHE